MDELKVVLVDVVEVLVDDVLRVLEFVVVVIVVDEGLLELEVLLVDAVLLELEVLLVLVVVESLQRGVPQNRCTAKVYHKAAALQSRCTAKGWTTKLPQSQCTAKLHPQSRCTRKVYNKAPAKPLY